VMFGGLDQMDVDFPKKSKGKGRGGGQCSSPRQEEELAKRALCGESQVALSLKELAKVLPMMAEELILVIWERAGLKADRNHVSFDVRSGEVELAAEVSPGLHLDTGLFPLGYIQIKRI
ncbi:hypothetical protein VP01_9343g1, partial [Puccinia sorghi]